MYVEFFGSPGVGKSYLTSVFASELDKLRLNVVVFSSAVGSRRLFILKKVLFLLMGLMLNGWLALRLLRFNLKGKRFVVFYNWLVVFGAYSISNGKRVVLLDQGFVQLLWSAEFTLSDKALAEHQMALLIKKKVFTQNCILIHVTAAPCVISGRLKERIDGKSPIESGATSEVEQSLKISDTHFHQLLSHDLTIFQLENSDSHEVLIKNVQEVLRNINVN